MIKTVEIFSKLIIAFLIICATYGAVGFIENLTNPCIFNPDLMGCFDPYYK